MEPEPHKPPIRFLEIDLLRFLAAFSVVLYHYTFLGHHISGLNPVAYAELEPITKYGYLGVELFFIVSGYVILMSAYGKSLSTFFISRVTRLYPAFWVGCAFSFLIVRFFGPGLDPSPTGFGNMLDVSLKQLAVNLTMFQQFVGVRNLDGAYWTLTYELLFYMLIAVLVYFRLFKHIIPILASWLLYTAVCWPVPSLPLAYVLFPRYSAYFIAGMLFFLIQQKWTAAWKLYAMLAVAYVLALRTTLADIALDENSYHVTFSPWVVGGVVTVFFGMFFLIISRKFTLKTSFYSTAGALTYPLYIIHQNVGYVVFRRLGEDINKYVLLILLTGSMLVLSWLIHTFVEKRLSKLLKRLLHRALPEKKSQLVRS